jgi:hypothetical protein
MGWWKFIATSGRRLGALPWEDKRRLLLAAALLPVASLLLRLFGFRRCQAWMARNAASSRPRRDAGPAANDWAKAANTARLVEMAARLTRSSCLPRSLITWRLVRRQGLDCELRIGVRKRGDRIQAHAWVEMDGRSLGREEPSFVPFEPDMMSHESRLATSPRSAAGRP